MVSHHIRKVGFHFVGEYAECIAHASNNWAWMEYELHTLLWSLADVSPALGACLSSQIFTFQAKLDALLSLMKLRKVPEEMIKEVNRFSSSVRPAQEARNRFAHDVWLNDNYNPDSLGKLRVTASKTLEYRVESFPIDRALEDLKKIENARLAFAQIRRAIESALLTLPKMSPEELHPITDIR